MPGVDRREKYDAAQKGIVRLVLGLRRWVKQDAAKSFGLATGASGPANADAALSADVRGKNNKLLVPCVERRSKPDAALSGEGWVTGAELAPGVSSSADSSVTGAEMVPGAEGRAEWDALPSAGG